MYSMDCRKKDTPAFQKIKVKLSQNFNNQVDVKYNFSLKPIFKIDNIRKNSPAAIAGLKKKIWF